MSCISFMYRSTLIENEEDTWILQIISVISMMRLLCINKLKQIKGSYYINICNVITYELLTKEVQIVHK